FSRAVDFSSLLSFPTRRSSDLERFLFASEVRALLATGLVSRQLDPVALDQYLTYQSVPAPRTLLEDVCAMPPGGWLRVGSDGRLDRKSTRLNSSHRTISYAVFC